MTDFFGHEAKPGLCVQIIACVIGEYNGNLHTATVVERKSSAQKWMVDMHYIHGLEKFFMCGLVAQGEIKARIRECQAPAANNAWFVILILKIAKSEHIHLMPRLFESPFV